MFLACYSKHTPSKFSIFVERIESFLRELMQFDDLLLFFKSFFFDFKCFAMGTEIPLQNALKVCRNQLSNLT